MRINEESHAKNVILNFEIIRIILTTVLYHFHKNIRENVLISQVGTKL